MRKHFLVLMAACFLATGLYAGGHRSNTKRPDKAAQYEQYAKNYDKQADRADKKGWTDLANSLRKCAAAKRIISQGYASGDRDTLKRGHDAYRVACKERDKNKFVEIEHYAKHLEEKAEKYEKKGKGDFAAIYRDMAKQRRKLAAAAKAGDRDLKKSIHEELKKLHNKKEQLDAVCIGKEADRIDEKAARAENDGNNELAQAYKQLATAKRNVADALKSGDCKQKRNAWKACSQAHMEVRKHRKQKSCNYKKKAKKKCDAKTHATTKKKSYKKTKKATKALKPMNNKLKSKNPDGDDWDE